MALTKKDGQLGSKIGQLEAKDAHLMTKINTLTHDKSALMKKNGELASELVSFTKVSNLYDLHKYYMLTSRNLGSTTNFNE